jgi:probable F420-dependent oxidoreductase
VKFSTGVPGLSRYPPSSYTTGAQAWQTMLTTEDFQRIARTAEDLGYDALSVPEHIAMPADLVDHMGAYWPDAFTAMAFAAGATTRIRVMSSVIVLPYHPPVPFAKAIATLDVLSGGRVTVAFGAGMARGEFAALGVPFHERGRITDEYIDVLRVLWTSEHPEFHGRYVDFAGIAFEPKPVQAPHPPIWIGGSSMAALRRAARVGDGWQPSGSQGGKGPWFNTIDDLPVFLDEARRVPGFAAREARFDIWVPVVSPRFGPNHEPLAGADRPPENAQEMVDRIGVMEDAGVTWTTIPQSSLPAPRTLDEHLDNLEWGAQHVLAAFRSGRADAGV